MADNETLVRAMQDMKKQSEKNTGTFVTELLRSNFLVPVSITPEPVDDKVQPGSVVSYITLREPTQDKQLIMAFTSYDEYLKYFKQGATQILRHSYNELRSLIMNRGFDGFLIDVNGENVAVTKETMINIARAAAPMTVQQEKIHISGPNAITPADDVSDEFKKALSTYLGNTENIKKCWLMQTKRENRPETTIVCVLDFEGDMPETFKGVASAVNRLLASGQSIGMISAADKVAAAAVEGVEPFYTK